MSRILSLYTSVIGKKAIVAVTGSLMVGFIFLHAWGNLKLFAADTAAGVPEIDLYAEYLRTIGEPIFPYSSILWIIRIVILVSLILHVICVIQLAQHNRRARPVRYQHARKFGEATIPARAMLYTGLLILAFIAVHLLQFTFGVLDPSRFAQGAVYGNLYRTFQLPAFVAFYVGIMGMIAVHLYHGIWSLFQTLGSDNPDRNKGLRALAIIVSAGLFIAFSSVPVSLFAGGMSQPPSQAKNVLTSDSR